MAEEMAEVAEIAEKEKADIAASVSARLEQVDLLSSELWALVDVVGLAAEQIGPGEQTPEPQASSYAQESWVRLEKLRARIADCRRTTAVVTQEIVRMRTLLS